MEKLQHRPQTAAERDGVMACPKQHALRVEGIRTEFAALDPWET